MHPMKVVAPLCPHPIIPKRLRFVSFTFLMADKKQKGAPNLEKAADLINAFSFTSGYIYTYSYELPMLSTRSKTSKAFIRSISKSMTGIEGLLVKNISVLVSLIGE